MVLKTISPGCGVPASPRLFVLNVSLKFHSDKFESGQGVKFKLVQNTEFSKAGNPKLVTYYTFVLSGNGSPRSTQTWKFCTLSFFPGKVLICNECKQILVSSCFIKEIIIKR